MRLDPVKINICIRALGPCVFRPNPAMLFLPPNIASRSNHKTFGVSQKPLRVKSEDEQGTKLLKMSKLLQ